MEYIRGHVKQPEIHAADIPRSTGEGFYTRDNIVSAPDTPAPQWADVSPGFGARWDIRRRLDPSAGWLEVM